MARLIHDMRVVKQQANDRGLPNTPVCMLGGRREVGFGRIPCQPGQVRKEAAAVSFIRVECPASHLTQPSGRTGIALCGQRPGLDRQGEVFFLCSDGFPIS